MDPQHGPSSARQIDPENRIFADLDRREIDDGEIPAAQGRLCERVHVRKEGRRLG
jgi:hypothetical protein